MNIDKLKEQALNLNKMIRKLEKKISSLDKQIKNLKEQGTIDAHPYWMKNKQGDPVYFCLYSSEKIKPKKSIQKIKYVGKNETEIKKLLEAIERGNSIKQFLDEQNKIIATLNLVETSFEEAKQYLENISHPDDGNIAPNLYDLISIDEPALKMLAFKNEILKLNTHQSESGFFITLRSSTHTKELFLCTQRNKKIPRFFKNMDRLLNYISCECKNISKFTLSLNKNSHS